MKFLSTLVSISRKRVTACDINKECTLIAVGNQIGEAFVANSSSGGIIYRLPGADEEICCIKFLAGCKFHFIRLLN